MARGRTKGSDTPEAPSATRNIDAITASAARYKVMPRDPGAAAKSRSAISMAKCRGFTSSV
jgi:hypothetical protein